MSKPLIAVFTLLILIGCKNYQHNVLANLSTLKQQTDTIAYGNKVEATDYTFFSDSVLHGQKELLKYYFTKYSHDTCGVLQYDKDETIESFEGLLKLGDVHNQIPTYVFVLNPFN